MEKVSCDTRKQCLYYCIYMNPSGVGYEELLTLTVLKSSSFVKLQNDVEEIIIFSPCVCGHLS